MTSVLLAPEKAVSTTLTKVTRGLFVGRLIPMVGNSPVRDFAHLVLRSAPTQAQKLWISAVDSEQKITLAFSNEGLAEFNEGITDMARGAGDWSTGGDNREYRLWFWWMKAKDPV